MPEKSHVGMLHELCPCCGNEAGVSILLDRRIKNTLEKDNYAMSKTLCKDCQARIDDDHVILVECKNPCSQDTLLPKDADRTGRIFFVRRPIAAQLFDVSPLPPFVFIDEEVGAMLEKNAQEVDAGESDED